MKEDDRNTVVITAYDCYYGEELTATTLTCPRGIEMAQSCCSNSLVFIKVIFRDANVDHVISLGNDEVTYLTVSSDPPFDLHLWVFD